MPAVHQRPCLTRLLFLVPALSVALLTGCVLDLQKHKVVFATPGAWSCNREKSMVPTAEGRLEPCTVCTNIARTTQAVTINKTEHTVPAQGHVAMCDTSAFVMAE